MSVRVFFKENRLRKIIREVDQSLCYEMMSSEESGEETKGQKDRNVVKVLPWLSTKVNNFF